MTKVNAYRKKSASVIDPYKFSSTGSIIDLTGLTRYTDQELTATIPNISASNNLNTALKILDGQIRKVNNNIPDLNTLATVARTGSYTDLSNKPTIPTATSQLTNDSGYLTTVGWTDVTGKPTSFTPAAHNQASNTINSMTGYTKATASAAINTNDSLNTAIGKLEYGLGTKLDSSATAQSANKLATSRTIALSGAVTGSGTFNGSADLNIATTLSGIDASKITSGTIDIARIPKAAISNLKVVADDTARFKLTISDVQNGDTVKVTGTGKMYYVADDTKLAEEAGYEIYNATADWDSITNKPTSYTPAAHTQAASTITGLASVATTGSYNDLSNKPTIPSKVSQLTNDSGYLTTVSWNTVTNKPSTYTPAAHNQASNTINAMTGYAKPSTTSAITTTDSLNAAIGKLEYGLGTKLDSTATAAKATADATGQTISTTYIKGLSVSGKVITYTKGDGSTGTITTQDTNTTYSPMKGATSSADGAPGLVPAPTAGNQAKYLRADGTWATPTDTNTTYSAGTGISLSGTTFSNAGVRSVTAGTSANQLSVNTGGTTTTITVDNVANAAAATKATQDYAGQRIDTTYIKGLSVSGKTITYTKGDGTTGTITTQDTDTKYSVMTGATADAAGSNGLVPAPAKGKQTSFLRGDGTWVIPTNTTYSAGAGISLSGTTFSNSGVRGVTAGSSANQISVNTGGTETTITVNNVANATAADKLKTGRTIALSGAVTGSVTFDGSANKTISTTLSNFDASKITTGTIDLARIPKAAIPELKIVADDTARFALTTSDIQNGDTVQVTSTGKMYYVKDQTKLSSEDGYAVYTAGAASSVPWSGVTGKPSSYTPAAHTQAASTITGLATVATSGSYADLSNKPTIPSKVSQLTNDSGYITGVSWSQVTNKPSTFTPAAHNQASNTITTLTGYSKPSSTGAIGTSDSLNSALGKLEKGLDGKLSTSGTAAKASTLAIEAGTADASRYVIFQESANSTSVLSACYDADFKYNPVSNVLTVGSITGNAATATKATQDSAGQQINTTYIKGLSVSGKTITYTKGDGTTGTITTQDTNTTYSAFKGATSSAAGGAGLVPAPAAGAQAKYLRADGTWQTPPDTNTTYSASNGISLSGTTFSNSGVRSIATGGTNGTISVNTGGTTANVAVKGLGSAAYTASSAYAAASHSHAASSITGLATVATSGSYNDLSNKPTSLPANGGTSTSSNWLNTNSSLTYGASGLNYFNQSTSVTSGATANANPTNDWYHILRMNHANSQGYFVDLAFCFHSDTVAFRRIAAGSEVGWKTFIHSGNIGSQSVASATKATQDSAGQQINTTYIKGLSVSGRTITYTKGDGSTGTITTQDTNTTYSAATSSNLGLVKIGSNITVSSGTISLTKANVTAALGYTPPTQDTNTTYSAGTGISLSGTTFSNSGVRAVTTGSTNGTISVNTNGTVNNIAVKGLGSAAYSNTSAFAAASHSHSNYALKTDIPSVWDSSGHLVSPAGWKLWVEN